MYNTVYAIAKNESKFVDQWYENVKGADAIVVLDTGSTDDTVEKLRAHGVKVVCKEINPWRFDEARNESLKLVPSKTDICVCTDFDELLDEGWVEALKENWIVGKTKQCYYTYMWKVDEYNNPLHEFVYSKIHSNDGHWYWKYPVHEDLLRAEGYELEAEDVINLYDRIILRHHPDPEKTRNSYSDLLEMRFNLYGDSISRIYSGIDYIGRNMPDKALEMFEPVAISGSDGTLRNNVEQAYCALQCALIFNNKRNLDRAFAFFRSALRIAPDYRDAYILYAQTLMGVKCFGQAEQVLRDGLEKSVRHNIWLEQDIMWGGLIYHYLAICCFTQNKMTECAIYANEACCLEPENKTFREWKEQFVGITQAK